MTAVTFSRADAGISGVFMSAETIAATTVFAAAGAAALFPHRARPAGGRPEYGGGFLRCSAHKRILRDRHTATDRKSTRLNSSHVAISYAVLCLSKTGTGHA